MKKIILLFSLVLMASSAFAQKKGKNQSLKSETDTVSYSYGLSLTQQGLMQYLTQQAILADTAGIRASYNAKVESAATDSEKGKLRKELAFKLDSINKANKRNITEFVKAVEFMLSAEESKKAYMEGLSIGGQMSKMIPQFIGQLYGENSGKSIDNSLFIKGMADALEGNKPLMDNAFEYMNEKMMVAQSAAEARKAEEEKVKHAGYIAEGERFMQENKAKEGVITLPSGLQYKIINAGTGDIPKASDRVKVHYRGSLLNGEVFDSSVERGEPAVFGVQQVIPGWTEALQLMPVGSKWMLYIPYGLAYGTRDMGKIKPYSNLIFEVELLGIE